MKERQEGQTDIRTGWERRGGRTGGALHHELRGHMIPTSSPAWPPGSGGAQQGAGDGGTG